MQLTISTRGIEKALAALVAADERVARKAVHDGVNDWTKQALGVAKQTVRSLDAVDTETMMKSLGRKVKSYRGGKIVVGIVGARRGGPRRMARRKGRRNGMKVGKAVAAKLNPRPPIPANYVHLVEYGTRPHAIGKGSSLGRAATPGKDGRGGRKAVARSQHGMMHPGAKPKPVIRTAYYKTRHDGRRLIAARVAAAAAALAARGK